MNTHIGAGFKIIFLLPLSILAGCGGAKNDSQTFALKIIDQAIPGSALRLFLEPPLSTQISSPSSVPTSRASFECYGVNLTGPGIVSDAALIDCEVGADNFQGRGPGLLSDLATDGEPIFIDNVPTGTGRRADIYGFYPTPPECGGSLANGTVIGAYYLGGLSFNFDSDATITIPTSFTAGSAHSIACTE